MSPEKPVFLLIYILLFGWSSPFVGYASPPPDTVKIAEYKALADSFRQIKEYDSASVYLRNISYMYRDAESWRNYIHYLCELAYNQSKNWRYPSAKHYAGIAAEAADKHLPKDDSLRGLAFKVLGKYSISLGESEEAIKYYLIALPIYESQNKVSKDISSIYHYLGIGYLFLGQYDECLNYQRKNLEVDTKLYGKDSEHSIDNYLHIGICYNNKGDYIQAKSYFQQSYDLTKKHKGPTHPFIARSSLYMAKVNASLGNYDLALQYGLETLDVQSNLIGARRVMLANTYRNIGDIYTASGDMNQALANYQAALDLQLKHPNVSSPHIADSYHKIADVYTANDQIQKAFDFYTKALKKRKSLLGERHISVSQSYTAFGKLYQQKSDLDKALAYYQKALIANSFTFDDSDSHSNPAHDDIISLPEFLNILEVKGEVLSEKSQPEDLLIQAVNVYQLATQIIERLRNSYSIEASKFFIQNRSRVFYEKGVEVCDQLYQKTGDISWIEKAFNFSEQGKSMVLFDAVKASGARQFSNIPEEILDLERSLKQDINSSQEKISRRNISELETDSTLQALQTKQFEDQRQYDSLINQMENDYPAYFQLKYGNKVSKTSEIGEYLGSDKALVSYFITKNFVYQFLITNKGLTYYRHEKGDFDFEKIHQLYKAISSDKGNQNFVNDVSFKFYQSLLAPSLESAGEINELLIIPDGELSYLPFEILLTEKPDSDTQYSQQMNYLIRHYQISYAYSATLLMENIRQYNQSDHDFAGFAPMYFSKESVNFETSLDTAELFREDLATLPGTLIEVEKANQIWGGTAYFKEEATETRLKKLPYSPAILHLATHGWIDNEYPERSYLRFSGETDDDDGILQISEIYTMELNSQLAVLSACNTGYGKLHSGEGMISMSRAFMYAGCTSILTSLWKAKDNPASTIMTSFYKYLREGKPKSEALHLAKLDYLDHADPLKSHPANWACFVIIGDPGVIEFDDSIKTSYLLLGLLGLIFTGIIILYFKSRNSQNIE